MGRRYGLIGQNGSGKTNFLQVLANREVRMLEGFKTGAQPMTASALAGG